MNVYLSNYSKSYMKCQAILPIKYRVLNEKILPNLQAQKVQSGRTPEMCVECLRTSEWFNKHVY